MSRQKINIRNDRGNVIASIEVENGTIIEETLQGCWLSDIDCDDNGTHLYRIDLSDSPDTLANYSKQALLDEIASRMID